MSDDIIRPNSDKALENRERPRKDDVIVRKRSGFMDFVDSLLPKDTNSFLRYILNKIIRPRTIDVVDDILKEGIDRALHPDNRDYYDDYSYRRSDREVPYYNYDARYESRRSSDYEPSRSERKVSPKEIEFRKRETAQIVLSEMKLVIREERFCTVGDFYEIVKRVTKGKIDISPTWAEESYGWSNLEGIRPEITYSGRYILPLPRTERI